MALLCAECASSNTTTGVADVVSCGNCGHNGPHKHAGEPSLHADSNVAEVAAPKKKAGK